MLDRCAKLRKQIGQDGIVVLPGVYDCVSAKAAERAGFGVVFVSGYAVSAAKLGLPDYGFLTATEMLTAVSQISGAVSVPVIADIDTGYGNPLNVYRTVEDIVKFQVAGVFLEDQLWPKRCGHMSGKKVIDASEQVEKIKAATEARRDSGLVIVARTDARAIEGLDGALKRADMYLKAGADVLFIEAPESMAELEAIPKAFPTVPCLANMIEHGKTPFLSAEALQAIGFKLVVFPLSALYAATAAMETVYGSLKKHGSSAQLSVPQLSFQQFADFIELEKFKTREQKFSQKS